MFHVKQLPQETLKMLNSYIDILMKWNEKVNLTSYTRDELINVGVYDANVLLKVLQFLKIKEILDIGTGYGMPGLVIKILDPSINVSLLDSNQKKIAFLEYVSKILKIPVNIYLKRLPDKKWEKKFDCVVSKASMVEEKLAKISLEILNPHGYLVYYSSGITKLNESCLIMKGAVYYKRASGNSYIVVRQKIC